MAKTNIADLKLQGAQTGDARDSMTNRINILKEDLGAYSNQMNAYSARKEEERFLAEKLRTVDDELDLLIETEQMRQEAAATQPAL